MMQRELADAKEMRKEEREKKAKATAEWKTKDDDRKKRNEQNGKRLLLLGNWSVIARKLPNGGLHGRNLCWERWRVLLQGLKLLPWQILTKKMKMETTQMMKTKMMTTSNIHVTDRDASVSRTELGLNRPSCNIYSHKLNIA